MTYTNVYILHSLHQAAYFNYNDYVIMAILNKCNMQIYKWNIIIQKETLHITYATY